MHPTRHLDELRALRADGRIAAWPASPPVMVGLDERGQ
jgi:hypothetical protein